jgi:hypothetical protein
MSSNDSIGTLKSKYYLQKKVSQFFGNLMPFYGTALGEPCEVKASSTVL